MVFTEQHHKALKGEGYKYLLIRSVELCPLSGRMVSIAVCARMALPPNMKESCTGIDDGMIVGLLQDPGIKFELVS